MSNDWVVRERREIVDAVERMAENTSLEAIAYKTILISVIGALSDMDLLKELSDNIVANDNVVH